jgi:hypothetical protein
MAGKYHVRCPTATVNDERRLARSQSAVHDFAAQPDAEDTTGRVTPAGSIAGARVDIATAPSREQSPALTTFAAPGAEMSRPAPTAVPAWPEWHRILFRFFSVYFLLQIAPWNWFRAIPGAPFVLRYYGMAIDRAVGAANARVFHVRQTLVPMNGSGDTSWAWTELWLYLSVAAVGCLVWTMLDRKRTDYDRLAFWLRTIVRYYIATAALSYGIIKLFLLQMPFPALSQLATPLGDLLPMRFSWLFIGYSAPYQFFSGAMETTAGLLLLYRRTVTAGLFAATGAFLNVVMINLSYDVPVKLYASHLLFACVFLLALDSKRLLRFLVLNQSTPATTAYTPYSTGPGSGGAPSRSRRSSSFRFSYSRSRMDGSGISRVASSPPARSSRACTTCAALSSTATRCPRRAPTRFGGAT